MDALNTGMIVGSEVENSRTTSADAAKSKSYRAPEKRRIGDLGLIKGRNFNDDKDRGNENYYR